MKRRQDDRTTYSRILDWMTRLVLFVMVYGGARRAIDDILSGHIILFLGILVISLTIYYGRGRTA